MLYHNKIETSKYLLRENDNIAQYNHNVYIHTSRIVSTLPTRMAISTNNTYILDITAPIRSELIHVFRGYCATLRLLSFQVTTESFETLLQQPGQLLLTFKNFLQALRVPVCYDKYNT
jgi:hypothetical protein